MISSLTRTYDLGNPSKLSTEEREELGITKKLPTSIEQALEAAQKDKVLEEALEPPIYNHYLAMKKAEQDMLNQMPEKERRIWLVERY